MSEEKIIKDQAEKLRAIVKNDAKKTVKECKANIITVTSGKGGVGKSNVAVNLALMLIEKGKRVLIIDADLGLANVEILMGVIPKYNLTEVINGNKKIAEIICDGPNGLKFISGGSGIENLANLSEDKLTTVARDLASLDEMFDTIIIDTGAGINETVMTFARIANEILLVTTSDPTAITDAYALLKVLKNSSNDTNVKVIVNMVRNKIDATNVFNKLNNVCEKFLDTSLEVIEFIPEDLALEKSVRMQRPVVLEYPRSEVTAAFRKLTNKVIDLLDKDNDLVEIEDVKVVSKRKGIMALFSFKK
ncbi:MAG: MinD/ParA family protein [Clostridia bacterium]|nr:MinD/ParA family protein [Clostridia bacterium]